jgi:hypothetical protein
MYIFDHGHSLLDGLYRTHIDVESFKLSKFYALQQPMPLEYRHPQSFTCGRSATSPKDRARNVSIANHIILIYRNRKEGQEPAQPSDSRFSNQLLKS